MNHHGIRLSVLDNEIAERTRKAYAFTPKASMSGAEKKTRLQQSESSKSLEQRQEARRQQLREQGV